jgi:bifunctional pyridoxal-dependent enzyme with beta-cystathionase and maltose regulon repressor activities
MSSLGVTAFNDRHEHGSAWLDESIDFTKKNA